MGIAIQELRPESLGEAVEFAKSCGSHVQGGRIVPALSLVAVDGDQLVAAALCVEQKNGRHRVEIGLTDPDKRADLNRTLVDKALMKLASAGIRKFDIQSNGAEAHRDFWHAVSWIDQTLSDSPTPAAVAPAPPTPASAPAAAPTPAAAPVRTQGV